MIINIILKKNTLWSLEHLKRLYPQFNYIISSLPDWHRVSKKNLINLQDQITDKCVYLMRWRSFTHSESINKQAWTRKGVIDIYHWELAKVISNWPRHFDIVIDIEDSINLYPFIQTLDQYFPSYLWKMFKCEDNEGKLVTSIANKQHINADGNTVYLADEEALLPRITEVGWHGGVLLNHAVAGFNTNTLFAKITVMRAKGIVDYGRHSVATLKATFSKIEIPNVVIDAMLKIRCDTYPGSSSLSTFSIIDSFCSTPEFVKDKQNLLAITNVPRRNYDRRYFYISQLWWYKWNIVRWGIDEIYRPLVYKYAKDYGVSYDLVNKFRAFYFNHWGLRQVKPLDLTE